MANENYWLDRLVRRNKAQREKIKLYEEAIEKINHAVTNWNSRSAHLGIHDVQEVLKDLESALNRS